jgi:hypothetical protein
VSLEAFHNFFRAQVIPEQPLFELCYLSAYDALPAVVQREGEAFWKRYYLARQPGLAWYTHLCLLTNRTSDPFSASTFIWHKGRLESGREYMVLEYPEPVPYQGPEEDDGPCLLAPYFSAVLRATTTRTASCYALGQTPTEDATTLRLCRQAAHYNLGIGPEPNLEDFLGALELLDELSPLAYTVRHQQYLDALDHQLMESAIHTRE